MGSIDMKGIYPRQKSILIYFRWNRKSYREALAIEPTQRNLKYAAAQRKKILEKIEGGTFDLSEFFPDSKNATKTSSGTFQQIADAWLKSKNKEIEETTAKEYRNVIYGYFGLWFDRKIDAFTSFREIDDFLTELELSRKTYNNLLSVLRMVFAYAKADGLIKDNPADAVKFAKLKRPAPDPLEPSEVDNVIAYMTKNYNEQISNYFEAALFLGFRPSEGIVLKWSDVDWNKKTITIQRALVRQIEKGTKTDVIRVVDLDDRCIAMLKRQKRHTFLANEYIFLNPATNARYANASDLVEKYWRPCLKQLGIRDRDARQTRHTCASMMLMAGCELAWSANQLGHSIEMFVKVYSKWVGGADQGRERAKLTKFSQTFHNEPADSVKSTT